MGGFAWVTLATNDSYSLGALVLAHSLKKVSTKYDLAVLITPGVTEVMREKLSAVFTLVKEVNVLDSKDEANLALLARPELGITFTKLHCWRLTQYDKCVFIDADALVIKNSDELFERDELSAAPDVGWPDCFNSGVFVFKPSQITFSSLTSHAKLHGSFDGGDQGLLNSFFSDWAHKDISKHLPFIYNMCSTATYSYLPAFKQFGEDVKIIHFIGSTKPWLQYFDTLTGQVQPHPDTGYLQPMLQHWWNIFCENVHPQLSPVMAGIAGALAKITLGETRSSEQVALEEHMRKYGWEQGQIDYMGRDSFDNIWKKINTTLETSSSSSKSDKVSVKTKSGETEEKVSTKKADLSTEKSSKNIPDETKTTDAAVSSDETLEKTINEAKEILSTNIESSPGSSSEVILSVKAAPPILSIKERGENDNKMSRKQQLKISRSQEESNISDTVIPLGFTSSTEPVSIDTKLDIEKQDLPIPETSAVGDLSLESTKDTEKLDTIKLELDETKNTDFVDEKTTTIMPEDVNVIENIESKILSDEAQGQTTTDIKIPATPTIIEATPPTSPQFETTEEKEEIKAPQKIARKIIKKEKLTQDDDAIEGTSDNKTSKLVDVGKSTTDENLETDESVPETPPPPTSVNPPTPPKRKSKISTAKNTTKKNNSEQ
ncbi:nucleolar and coiled-body phosphoprotein 1 isoform X5 [Aphidius gifuensis]|uniref:nucleolar and coiled-body phosphoprotein 1 isoform X5 n=1 Tax=Aphidius gifuensis TaxID=684658 RepID=UPI001CDC610C|nr:nucleolar and coiled-body phosphoprotein 1 isoform X5 [Aphidius gifuensis]